MEPIIEEADELFEIDVDIIELFSEKTVIFIFSNNETFTLILNE